MAIRELEGSREETARLERELEHWTREFDELKARASGVSEPQLDESKDALESAFDRLGASVQEMKTARDGLTRESETELEKGLENLKTALEDFASYVMRAGR